MDHDFYVKCIVEGMELYFRTFAQAGNMYHQAGDIEWISPLPNAAGPSLVFKVSLDERSAFNQIDELISSLMAGTIPLFWVISPTCTPKNIMDYLISKGFKDLSDPEHPELGMALDIEKIPKLSMSNPKVEVKKIKSLSEFGIWIDVVNEALHGWPMLNTECYYPWISRDELSFYLAYLDGIPVSTVATIQDGDKASIEFMSTLKEYRNQGVATIICMEALQELQKKCVRIVTLRSSNEAIPLYTKLGFKTYYEQVLISYQKK